MRLHKEEPYIHIKPYPNPRHKRYPRPAFIPTINPPRTTKALTTIIAIRCKDGIIMTADTQITIGEQIKERGSKIHEVGKHALIGCAGTATYIDLFVRRYVTPRTNGITSEDYYNRLKQAVLDYNICARTIIEGLPQFYTRQEKEELVYPQAIFGCYDQGKYRLFELRLPAIPRELMSEEQDRAIVGMGELYAPFLFVQLERLLRMIKPVKVWSELSTNLVSKITYLTMERVISYDLYTGGEPIVYQINESGVKYLPKSEIFSRDDKTPLSELIESAIEEMRL